MEIGYGRVRSLVGRSVKEITIGRKSLALFLGETTQARNGKASVLNIEPSDCSMSTIWGDSGISCKGLPSVLFLIALERASLIVAIVMCKYP